MTINGIEANIANLLMTTFAGQTFNDDTSTPLTVAWPEVSFDPSNTPKYLNLQLLFNRAGWYAMAGVRSQRIGLLQVTVVWPKQQGEIKPLSVASAIADSWKIGTTLYGTDLKLKIYQPPYLSGPFSDAFRVQIPVNIPWAAFAA